MGRCAEFVRMLQLCQTARRVMGLEGAQVSPQTEAQAEAVDRAKSERPSSCLAEGHSCVGCYDCERVRGLADGLIARLDVDGIGLPADQQEALRE